MLQFNSSHSQLSSCFASASPPPPRQLQRNPQRCRRALNVVRAEPPQQQQQEKPAPPQPLTKPINPNAPPPPPQNLTAAQQAEAEKPLILQKGQGTAVVTGAISIVFGVGYLLLVFLMDWRGGEMLPPPPEAFGP